MDPHLLRTFVAVAETGSFSAAAQRLSYTQSAVSQQIAALEADLGIPLLTRRPVALTTAGERLHRHATLLLTRLAAARADVTRSVAPPGRLIVGLTPLAWSPRVMAALARIRAEHPRLSSRVLVDGRDRIVTAAVTGEIDLALVDGFAAPSDPLPLPHQPRAGAIGAGEEPAVVAVPARHPLARRTGVNLADLADAAWIDAPVVAPRARLPVDGLRAGMRYDGGDVTVLIGLAEAGQGLTVLPAGLVAARPGLAGVPITAPRLVHRIELLRPEDPGEPAAALAASLLRNP
ncbi:LysR family transcriptional regulator [Actinoplanes utahensis]|uniref:LysR family transcriptional regulator n=1 Tax=Actinoplanes utahensis TaxID=1869 RepID=A0A0A6UNJ9_ACTUT|nr:LysR family transcriptional regulator [Actinoplanes utahensis]KHD77720.1 LysR family transcriptional regulator [Actinoplanes utahensis]GIF31377.1 LysR family transcriptional regulator [Actinoplanes utahensis]